MIRIKNKILDAFIDEKLKGFSDKLSLIGENKFWLFQPIRGIKEEIAKELLEFKLNLISTGVKTLVLEDLEYEVFFKMIFCDNLKHKILGILKNEGLRVYKLSEYFRGQGIKLPEVLGYGSFVLNPFYVIPKMKGKSFLEIIKSGEVDIDKLFYKIIDEVIKIHREGYFIGDANIKHFFFIDKEIEGIIDFDSIRKVKIFKIKRFCRDLGYLLRPELKIENEKIQDIVIYYSKKMNLPYSKILLNTERYRFRRWGYKILK